MTLNKMNLGLGPIGGDGIMFRRKFRWYVTYNLSPKVISAFVKVGTRPRTDEHLAEPGELCVKNHWLGSDLDEKKRMFITHLGDIPKDIYEPLFDYFAKVWEAGQQEKDPPKIGLSLVLYDGCANVLETWHLRGATPVQIDLGDLSYGGDQMLEVEWKYDSVEYKNGIEETEINYLSKKYWVPGKSTWKEANE